MIGELDVERLLASIPSHLLSEWMAYDELEPRSVDLLPEMLATITSIYAEVHRDPSKRREPFSTEDFLLKPINIEDAETQYQRGQSVDEQIYIAAMWVTASGGKDLRKIQ